MQSVQVSSIDPVGGVTRHLEHCPAGMQLAQRSTSTAALPRVVLSTPPPIAADQFWSLEKQSAYVATIRDAIQQLTAAGIKRIHMVLAAPSSLSLRIGMAYDRRLSAELVVYQYERRLAPPYPWGILLPSASVPVPLVIR